MGAAPAVLMGAFFHALLTGSAAQLQASGISVPGSTSEGVMFETTALVVLLHRGVQEGLQNEGGQQK